MPALNILCLNFTLKPRPEISNVSALWQAIAQLYQQREDCIIEQFRPIDDLADFSTQFAALQAADIVILGLPLVRGRSSSVYAQFQEQLQSACQNYPDPQTGRSPLYNTVLGVMAIGDAAGGQAEIAQICYDWGQLGCINPPQNTMTWFQPLDTTAEFIEAKGHKSKAVNRAARLLVENSVALAKLLRQQPLNTNVNAINQAVQAIANATQPERGALLVPQVISATPEANSEAIAAHHIPKRIWTMVQAGIERGFTMKVLSLNDRLFRAEREGKGFIYKIYPGYFSFRRQYADYDAEKLKSHKLNQMHEQGLPVPINYGVFGSFAEIPLEQLVFPLVAKPDSGSLSQNVFTQLADVVQLQEAVGAIAASGETIKLESQISGQDYRVLIVNHQYAGCVERRPANVVGDGEHTILELFEQRNQESGRGDRYEGHTTLHQLVFDATSRRLLDEVGYTLETVLPAGELFYLQTKITAALGADYVDCTEDLHPSIIQACEAFAQQFSTLTLGFDLITMDISRPLAETQGAFNEYNFLPYVDLHEHCNIGRQRPVCRLVWDYIEANAERVVTREFKPF
ncbi:MAG: hypothetical protein F6J87_06960 [Spirulina sp. SIO3F2]|nr:hypothetical protein [Spirulina sp. SIO3F2]